MKTKLLIVILLFCSNQLISQITINRIDPPNWWAGMKNHKLQLLVHGNNISKTIVHIAQKDITIEKTHSLSNNYLAIDLNLKNASPCEFNIEFKQNNKTVATYKYELKKRTGQPKDYGGFNTSDVFYLIMPDRFANGNPENDHITGMLEKADRSNPDGRHGGDIEGIQKHLDYLHNLGVTTIWATPLLENNMPKYSYHGYAITDFYKIDPRFGTNESYQNLAKSIHNKGMKIVMDMVFNHLGTESYLIKDLPTNDWIHQWKEFTRSNYRATVITDPYHSNYDKTLMADGWFDVTMADFNQNNPFVARYLIQNSIWWVEYAKLDGIRQDTYPYPDKDFMAQWMKELRTEYPTLSVVGEAWINYPPQISYWLDNTKNKDGYRSYLNHAFDFPLMMAIQKAFNEEEGWDTGLIRLYEILAQDFLYSDPSKLITFVDNHDIERMYPVLGSIENVKMALAFLATSRGIPLIYYGTEALSDRGNLEGDAGKRKDFPGGWKNDSVDFFTNKNLSPNQQNVSNYISNLLHWRKTNDCIHHGKLTHYIPENNTYVYFRSLTHEAVMVIINNNKHEITISTERFTENLAAFAKGKDVESGAILNNLKNITILPKSVKIIELSK